MNPSAIYSDEQAYDHVVSALQRRGMSQRKAARTLARLSRRSLVRGAHALAGDDINYHVAFHALRLTAPDLTEMGDDTHPHTGMSTRLCVLFSAAMFASGLYFTQQIMDFDVETGRLEFGMFVGTFLLGAFFGIKGWVKWLRS